MNWLDNNDLDIENIPPIWYPTRLKNDNQTKVLQQHMAPLYPKDLDNTVKNLTLVGVEYAEA